MLRWMKPAKRTQVRNELQLRPKSRFTRLALEALEDRINPAVVLAPTLLDPTAAVRVDQNSYVTSGGLQEAAKNNTTISAYRDSNQNGIYDAGRDAFAASANIARNNTSFALSVPLQQNANNQFFLVLREPGGFSAAVKVPLITEDSLAPRATGITRLGSQLTNASDVQFAVNFSEPVTGVDSGDFQVVRSGSVSSTGLSVSGTGASYTVTVTGINGSGTLKLNLIDNDSIRDILTSSSQSHPLGGARAGNGNFTTGQTYTIERTPPVVTRIVRSGPAITNSTTVAYAVTFSENVTGVDTGDFALTASGVAGATVASVTGSGSTRTVVVNTGTGSGSIRLDLIDNDTIIDAAGNSLGGAGAANGSFTTALAYTIDKTAPLVASIVRAGPAVTSASRVTYNVTFTENVTGVDNRDFVVFASGVTRAGVVSVTGSGSTRTVVVNTGIGSGDIRLDLIDNDSIRDILTSPIQSNPLGGAGAANGNFTTGQVFTIDRAPPIVTSIVRAGPATTGASSVAYTVAFSENVTGVDAADFTLSASGVTGAGVASVAGSGSTRTVMVNTGTGASGTIRLNLIDNNTIIDAAGNSLGGAGAGNGNFTTGETYTIERIPPVVSSIVRSGPATTNTSTVGYTVTFNENVTEVDVGDFSLFTTEVIGATVESVTGSGSTRTVVVNTGTGNGSIRLDLIDNDTIIDAAGNSLGGAGAANGNFTTALAYTIDKIAPLVASIDRAGAVTTNGGSVNFTVTFSELVTGLGTDDFALTASGLAAAAITGFSGSGATYTVTVNTGAGTGSVRLDLIDDDSIIDAAGNALGALASGTFTSGQNFLVVSADTDSLATVVVPPLDINLLGLRVQTSEIIVSVSASAGDGKLLGNLLTVASNLIDLQEAADALNQVLSTTVSLLNSSDLGIDLGGGTFDARPVATTDVLTLHVAPVQLDLLGALVNTSPIDVAIAANSGQGLILGNIVYDLANLFNDLPGQPLNIDTLNQQLGDLLGLVNTAIGVLIPPADVPTVLPEEGQILSLTVPALDLNLLGLAVETSPITVNADAAVGDGKLLGNVLTSLLDTLDADPQKIADLNNTLNGVLARVVGVLNAADLTISSVLVDALPPALQTLLDPLLVAPADSSAPILDLVIASQDGTSPPVDVDLLGLVVTTSNIDARLSATTGNGQILGNLLYNVANLANPNGASGLLALLNALGSGNLDSTAGSEGGGGLSSTTPAPQQLLQIELKPLDINLLGLQVTSDPIIVTLSAQGGNAKLLGNLLGAVSTLVNLPEVEDALNNALGTVVDLVNSVDLSLPPGSVGTGVVNTDLPPSTEVLDVFVAPVYLDLLGLLVTTSPIHLTITAHVGEGLVLGNIVSELAHLFDELSGPLSVDDINDSLEQLLADLDALIPGIPPADTPPVTLEPGQFLELTVPALDLDLLGLLLNTSPITVDASAQTGDGNLLGNLLDSLLLTIDATPGNLTTLSENLNGLLAKVFGVFNAADLSLSQELIGALPPVIQTLLSPILISPTPGATTQILDLVIASPDNTPPVRADLLGLVVTTSDIDAELWAQTGDGQILGNLLFNVSHLLDQGNALSLLFLLTQLAQLGPPPPAQA